MPESDLSLDSKAFRQALGAFATGVCVVTTRNRDGTDVGLTANSFSSVSLNPPMILWSLANTSSAISTFRDVSHFGVHILASDQDRLSAQFATKGIDRFQDVEIIRGINEIPLLRNCVARFECKTAHQYDGGDHTIFIGEVVSFNRSDLKPLIFHGGRYGMVVGRDDVAAEASKGHDGALSLSENGLNYLLWRAFLQFRHKYYEQRKKLQWSKSDSYILQTISMEEGRTIEGIDRAIQFTGLRCTLDGIKELAARGLVSVEEPLRLESRVWLTESARASVYHLVAIARAVEGEALEDMDFSETYLLKKMLRHIVDKTSV